jgi:hypothetical protein
LQEIRPFPRTLFHRLVSHSPWQPAWFVLLAVVVGGALAVLPPAAIGAAAAANGRTCFSPSSSHWRGCLPPCSLARWARRRRVLLDSGQFYLLFSLLAWLAHGLRQRRLFVPRTFLAVPLALFTGVAAMTVVDAASYNFGLKELLKWGEMLAIMLLVVDRVSHVAGTPRGKAV